MRGVKKAISIVGDSDGEGENGTERKTRGSGTSAIERISRGRNDVPESVSGYALETNSPINVRWRNDDEDKVIECGRTGGGWQVEVHEGDNIFVFSEHGSFEDALDTAEKVMSGEYVSRDDGDGYHKGSADTEGEIDGDSGSDSDSDGDSDGVPSEFEQEVEEVLDGIDEDSMESVEEVGEIFGD